jgi:hypothetical protein
VSTGMMQPGKRPRIDSGSNLLWKFREFSEKIGKILLVSLNFFVTSTGTGNYWAKFRVTKCDKFCKRFEDEMSRNLVKFLPVLISYFSKSTFATTLLIRPVPVPVALLCIKIKNSFFLLFNTYRYRYRARRLRHCKL